MELKLTDTSVAIVVQTKLFIKRVAWFVKIVEILNVGKSRKMEDGSPKIKMMTFILSLRRNKNNLTQFKNNEPQIFVAF